MKSKIIKSNKIKLDKRSIYLRSLVYEAIKKEKRGHIGPAMSLIEILRVLYDKFINKKNSKFILSKGHGCLALYAILFDKGFITKKDLINNCSFNSILGGHPEHDKIKGVEISTGSLGHGLPIAVGMALASKIKKKLVRYYVVCGDGELNEGSVWESFLAASKHKLNNLTIFIDYNKFQSYGKNKEILDLEPLTQKIKSFKFNTLNINGHDIIEIEKSIKIAHKQKNKPTVIICHTVKGKGILSAENNAKWHYKSPLSNDDIKEIERSLS